MSQIDKPLSLVTLIDRQKKNKKTINRLQKKTTENYRLICFRYTVK